MNTARIAKLDVLVQKHLMLQPGIAARGPQLDKLDILHLGRAGRRDDGEQRDALPNLVWQLIGVYHFVVSNGGDFDVDFELGPASFDGFDETVWEGDGVVQEELVVCCDGHFGGFLWNIVEILRILKGMNKWVRGIEGG